MTDIDDTWPCVYCRANNPDDGPPQCGCGEMKPGWECCAWCQEHYGPISTFKWDADNEPICVNCYHEHMVKRRKFPLYFGFGVLLAIALVLWAILVVGE